METAALEVRPAEEFSTGKVVLGMCNDSILRKIA
jgi:hypothetical protein